MDEPGSRADRPRDSPGAADPAPTQRMSATAMTTGFCLGLGIGVVLGLTVFDGVGIGIGVGIALGAGTAMAMGLASTDRATGGREDDST